MTSPQRSPHAFAFRLLFAAQISVGIGQAVLFAVLPPAAREIDLSPFKVSMIFVVSATIWVFVSPMWGRRSDVWGRRRVILIGLLGFALSMGLLATTIQIGLAGLLPIAVLGVLAPLYLSALLAAGSAAAVWFFLPEEGTPRQRGAARPSRLSFRDPRVLPFVTIAASLQAVRATTVITLAFLLQDRLGLNAKETVQYTGMGFTVLALAGLLAQLVLVQRLRPSARWMIGAGLPLLLLSFIAFCIGGSFPVYLIALSVMGIGVGLARPGSAAGASIAVEPHEQGAVAGLMSGVAVVGNIFGPMVGTALYELTPAGPYLLNAGLMVAALIFFAASPRARGTRS